nr:PREDICTED: uncharacterized protein LOC109035897 [Bemisia tabaci]
MLPGANLESKHSFRTLSNSEKCEIPRSWFRLGSNLGVPKLVAGTAYMFSLAPRYGQNTGPWHAFFALTSDTYFNIKPTSLYWCTVTPQILSTDTLKGVPFKKIDPEVGRSTLKPESAIILARRMVGRVLLYRSSRCNCRHYTDYLLYGQTYGFLWDPTYNSMMSQDCPLHRIVTNADDVNAPEFTLMDGSFNPIQLGPPVPTTPSRSLKPKSPRGSPKKLTDSTGQTSKLSGRRFSWQVPRLSLARLSFPWRVSL